MPAISIINYIRWKTGKSARFNGVICSAKVFRRDIKSLDEILGKFLQENDLRSPLQQTHVVESWEQVAGPVVARYTEEKFIRNQTLFVKISNPALRSDLSMMKTQLVNKLNAEAGGFVIADIRFY